MLMLDKLLSVHPFLERASSHLQSDRKPGQRPWVDVFHLAKFNISTSLSVSFMLKISVKTGQLGVRSVCKAFGCCSIYAKIFVFYRLVEL